MWSCGSIPKERNAERLTGEGRALIHYEALSLDPDLETYGICIFNKADAVKPGTRKTKTQGAGSWNQNVISRLLPVSY